MSPRLRIYTSDGVKHVESAASTPSRYSTLVKVPTVDTNLVQSLINIMECQLEEAFEAIRGGGGAGGRKQSLSKSKASAGAEEAETMDPKVWLSIDAVSSRI